MRASELVRRTAIITFTILGILALVLLLVKVRSILLWVLIGIILAIALKPAVDWLVRHRLNRVLAALLVSFVALGVIVAVLFAIAAPVVLQSGDFIRALPQLVHSLFIRGGQLNFVEVRLHVLEHLRAITPSQVVKVLMGNQQTIIGAVTAAATLVAAVVTILTIMVMMLIEGPRAWGSLLESLVENERGWAERIGQNFLHATGGYVRGNLAISLVAGVVSYVVLKILGVPYAETLAVLVAILDIVPLVGATIGAVIVCIVGFAAGGHWSGFVTGIVLVIFFILYQQFENNVLQNMVYSRTVSLSPLVVFIAALIGASLLGIVGVLLAIPMASAGWVLGRDLIALRKERHGGAVHAPMIATAPPGGDPPG